MPYCGCKITDFSANKSHFSGKLSFSSSYLEKCRTKMTVDGSLFPSGPVGVIRKKQGVPIGIPCDKRVFVGASAVRPNAEPSPSSLPNWGHYFLKRWGMNSWSPRRQVRNSWAVPADSLESTLMPSSRNCLTMSALLMKSSSPQFIYI